MLSVLSVVYRIWAAARMVQLEDWFRSWVPVSVLSALRWKKRKFLLVLLTPMFIFLWLMLSSLLIPLVGVFWIGS